MQQCTAAALLSLCCCFFFIFRVLNLQTQNAYPWESAIWKITWFVKPDSTQLLSVSLDRLALLWPWRFRHTGPDFIKKRLHPRERQNNICSECAQLHVYSHCEMARSWTVLFWTTQDDIRHFFPLNGTNCQTTYSKLKFLFGHLKSYLVLTAV